MAYCANDSLTNTDLDYLQKISFEKSWTWWLNHIGTFVIFIIGLWGNILSLIVLCRRPLIQKSYTQYLIALAIVDTGAIFSETIATLDDIYQYQDTEKRTLIQHTDFSCKLYYYIRFTFYTMSSWIVVALAIERSLAIKFPLWSKYICSVTNARRIIFLILFLTMIIQSYHLITKGLDCSSSSSIFESSQNCRCKTLRDYAAFDVIFTIYFWRLILMTLLPLIIIITVNIIIMNKLFNEKCLIDRSNSAENTRHKIILLYKVSRVLVIVSSLYLFLHVPGSCLEIIKVLFIHAFQICNVKWYYYIYIAQDIFDLLTNFNYGINFYLYIISGKHIRRELRKRSSSSRSPVNTQNEIGRRLSCFPPSPIPFSNARQRQDSNMKSVPWVIRSSV